MKPNYNNITAYEKLISIIDKEGKIQVNSKEVIAVCRFLEAVYYEGFDAGYLCKGSNAEEIKFLENVDFDLPKIRKRYNLTQTEFAKKLEVSISIIAKVETGSVNISKKNKQKIQHFLNNNPL